MRHIWSCFTTGLYDTTWNLSKCNVFCHFLKNIVFPVNAKAYKMKFRLGACSFQNPPLWSSTFNISGRRTPILLVFCAVLPGAVAGSIHTGKGRDVHPPFQIGEPYTVAKTYNLYCYVVTYCIIDWCRILNHNSVLFLYLLFSMFWVEVNISSRTGLHCFVHNRRSIYDRP